MINNNRREFLKTVGLVGAVLLTSPIMSKADAKIFGDRYNATQQKQVSN